MVTVSKMENLKHFLDILRKKRNFNVDEYIDKKTNAINKFFIENNLDSAVVGVSGGVDSAVVFSLLSEASKKEGSPIKKILGLIMPIYGNGTTNQGDAMNRAKDFCNNVREMNNVDPVHSKTTYHICNLTKAYDAYIQNASYMNNAWSNGQLASIVRTPCLYHHAAQLQDQGYKSIVVGTTNRDEGSYIGFFGKASDAMVDLQPIADIHKSEVYQVATKLKVTREIIGATPAGDVHDGRCDEEMIGAPYWFLELYLLMKENPAIWENQRERSKDITFDKEDEEVFETYSKAIEDIHKKNSHKYKVGSPAHFIDVMNRKIEGGWQ